MMRNEKTTEEESSQDECVETTEDELNDYKGGGKYTDPRQVLNFLSPKLILQGNWRFKENWNSSEMRKAWSFLGCVWVSQPEVTSCKKVSSWRSLIYKTEIVYQSTNEIFYEILEEIWEMALKAMFEDGSL